VPKLVSLFFFILLTVHLVTNSC